MRVSNFMMATFPLLKEKIRNNPLIQLVFWLHLFSAGAVWAESGTRVPNHILDLLLGDKKNFFYADMEVILDFGGHTPIIFPVKDGVGHFKVTDFELHGIWSSEWKKTTSQGKLWFDFKQTPANQIKVFYLPLYQPLSRGLVTLGASCDHIFELSTLVTQQGLKNKKGLDVFLEKDLFFQTLGGDWFFAWEVGELKDLFIAWVRFENEHYSHRRCEP